MTTPAMIGADLIAICLLTFGIYFPRHRRKDLLVAFLGVNVGVLAVSIQLGSSTVGVGLGLGLFGVLSIIRLRSSEIAQHEVAYYFAALTLGLLAGLSTSVEPLTLALMALVVITLWAGDHPRLFRRHRSQTIVLDHAYLRESDVVAVVGDLLGSQVKEVVVQRTDLVNDSMTVEVRYRIGDAGGGSHRPADAEELALRRLAAHEHGAVSRS